ISRNLFVMEPGWDRTRNYEGSFDHHVQKVYLQPLVEAIRAKTPVRDDQARIAISLVQNIPYDWGRNKSVLCQGCFMPYATLHTQRGICMDKSILMAYLLRELGYDVALLSFPQENHMAVGIRTAPPYDYRNSGYAFIESTQPALPTYSGWIVLRSTPIVEKVQGRDYQFDSIIEEYNDVRQIELLRNKSNQNPVDLGSILERYRIMSKYG
ncbi:MAG TPA: transglutaminase-like domain-containing protein, partial [Methanoregula sp.]|nr:transglutaminase-like domain-containing protein [Methanoregula sp.]